MRKIKKGYLGKKDQIRNGGVGWCRDWYHYLPIEVMRS